MNILKIAKSFAALDADDRRLVVALSKELGNGHTEAKPKRKYTRRKGVEVAPGVTVTKKRGRPRKVTPELPTGEEA